MPSARASRLIWALAPASAFGACSTDDRTLVYEARPPVSSGGIESSAGGSAAGGDSNQAGAAVEAPLAGGGGGEASMGGAPNAAVAGEAGSTNEAGAGPREAGGTSAGHNSSGGSGARAGSGASGSSGASAGSNASGSGGASAGATGCPDLNGDGKDDCGQTLLQNSRFDTGAMGWEAEPSLLQSWQRENASGGNDSGSLQLEDKSAPVDASGNVQVGSHQCLRVESYATYDVAARVRLPENQADSSGGVNVWLFDDDACAGNLVGGATPARSSAAGTWVTVNGNVWIPSSARSMLVRLVLVRPFKQSALRVQIDDVLVVRR